MQRWKATVNLCGIGKLCMIDLLKAYQRAHHPDDKWTVMHYIHAIGMHLWIIWHPLASKLSAGAPFDTKWNWIPKINFGKTPPQTLNIFFVADHERRTENVRHTKRHEHDTTTTLNLKMVASILCDHVVTWINATRNTMFLIFCWKSTTPEIFEMWRTIDVSTMQLHARRQFWCISAIEIAIEPSWWKVTASITKIPTQVVLRQYLTDYPSTTRS